MDPCFLYKTNFCQERGMRMSGYRLFWRKWKVKRNYTSVKTWYNYNYLRAGVFVTISIPRSFFFSCLFVPRVHFLYVTQQFSKNSEDQSGIREKVNVKMGCFICFLFFFLSIEVPIFLNPFCFFFIFLLQLLFYCFIYHI